MYKYFGDCKNTVDKDHMWDVTQMSSWLKTCKVVSFNDDIISKLNNGDRKIPSKLTKTIDKLKSVDKLNDLSLLTCGIDENQRIMFIYLTKTNTHYFFDCK